MDTTKLKIEELSVRLNSLKERTISLLENNGMLEARDQLLKELAGLKERSQIKIAFVGQYSSGKSTIISALTGNKDIVIDANVSTDVVSRYEWNNVILMDTPGILAGKKEKHDQDTIEALKECDLIVYVLTSQLFDNVIFNNFIDLAYVQKFSDKMLIAINKMSMENGEFDQLCSSYMGSIKDAFKERGYDFSFNVVFLDAADYIEGKESEDEDFIELSNFATFINSLNSFIDEKGLIKKELDTPVRVLRKYVSDIAIPEDNQELLNLLNQYAKRFEKFKRDILRDAKFIFDKFEDDSMSDVLVISKGIGEKSSDEFEAEVKQFQHQIDHKLNDVIKETGEMVDERYKEMQDEFDQFNNKEVFTRYEESLDFKIQSPNITEEERKSYEQQKFIMKLMSDGANKVSSMAGETLKFFGGKVSDVSGTALHEAIYGIGKFFGHKFGPWEAVKIAGRVGKFAKFGVPIAAAAFDMWLTWRQEKQEEKRAAAIVAAKQQFNEDFRKNLGAIRSQLDKEFGKIVDNYNNVLAEINKQKLDLASISQKNKQLIQKVKEMDAEYVDFIEILDDGTDS